MRDMPARAAKNMDDKKPLTKKEIEENLKGMKGWTFANDKISKEFKFADFVEAVNFIRRLVPFCEKMDHHPDIHIYYNKILFELQRFDIGGKVTKRDFTVAQEIERLNTVHPA